MPVRPSDLLDFALTGWAYLPGAGMLSKGIARQAVVVMSLPRSGSSWVGAVVGAANEAMYLREPLTYSWAREKGGRTVFDVDSSSAPAAYVKAARLSFDGIPRFPRSVLRYPSQWKPFGRKGKTVVVKEVNPLAAQWLAEKYDLKLIFIYRHPVAIALSCIRQGWWEYGDWEYAAKAIAGPWRAVESLLRRTDSYVIVYEELCVDPLGHFNQIYDWCSFNFDGRVKNLICNSSKGDNFNDPYSTSRPTRLMPDRWKSLIPQSDVANFYAKWLEQRPSHYLHPAEWGLEA